MQFLIHKYIVYIQTCICNPCNHVHLNLETDLPSNTTKYMPAEKKIFFTLEFKTLNGKLHLPLLLLMESKLKIIFLCSFQSSWNIYSPVLLISNFSQPSPHWCFFFWWGLPLHFFHSFKFHYCSVRFMYFH